MATTAQILANRSNAARSTGPRTVEGIENSRFNATRHGLTGKQVVLRGEDPAPYDALRAALYVEHQPANEREAMLVEEIAQNWWRLQRARRAEAEILDYYQLVQCACDPNAIKPFQLISRYLGSLERAWRKACTELDQLQRARALAALETAPPAEIGSVSQTPAATPEAPTAINCQQREPVTFTPRVRRQNRSRR